MFDLIDSLVDNVQFILFLIISVNVGSDLFSLIWFSLLFMILQQAVSEIHFPGFSCFFNMIYEEQD